MSRPLKKPAHFRPTRVGSLLKAPEKYKGSKVRYYQWKRCGIKGQHCRKIKRATHRIYHLRASDAGHAFRVALTVRTANGKLTVTSAPTPVGPVIASGGGGTSGFQSLTWIASWQCTPGGAGCLPSPGTSPWNGITEVSVFGEAPQTTSPYINTTANYNMSPSLQQNLVSEIHAAGKLALLDFGGQGGTTAPGWTAACQSSNQSTFINALIGEMQKYGYDGLDIDMEEDPTIAPWSMASWTSCMAALRAVINGVKTAAGNTPIMILDSVPDRQQNIAAAVAGDFDRVLIMGYQYGCGGDQTTCPDIAHELNLFHGAGVPVNKLMVAQGLDPGPGYPSQLNPANCGQESAFLKSQGAAGTGYWTMPSGDVNGQWTCFDLTAPYLIGG